MWPRWRDRLIALPRLHKRAILVAHDLVALALAMWLALSVRWNEYPYWPETPELTWLYFAAPVLAVATFGWFGIYRLVTRYMGTHGTSRLIGYLFLSVLVWSLVVLVSGLSGVPRSLPFLYGVFATVVMVASRSLAALVLKSAGVRLRILRSERTAVLIYGTGPSGIQMLDALRRSTDLRVTGFIDVTSSLWGQYIAGVKVYRPEKIERLIERDGVKEIILALPEAKRRERRAILKELQRFPVQVKLVPAMEDLASGRVTVSSLKAVDVEDLLGRDPVPPDPQLLARGIRGKTVMVTGAGGSIGSELVRQIVRQTPACLVLFELSEAALYEIEIEVADHLASLPESAPRPRLVGVLGSVLDERVIRDTIRKHRVETIYHAAAYKHVPIVEANPAAGLVNNTFGTEVAARVAREESVERFVLISTDKAVRPTNVMGASKRLAELVLQAHAADPACETVFTMVRFGNVLESSGSVVPRFRRQIHAGGPVTVTHPEVTRYFMSIPEAAELVLQAGAMGSGGEVFVLEMGELVKIDQLARTMIRLMGLEVRDESNPDGDIEIEYTGLRHGEKLYEELLLGESTTGTEHPRILRNSEPFVPAAELKSHLDVLRAAIADGNVEAIDAVLMRTVEGYRPVPPTAELTRSPATLAPPSRMLH